MLWRNLEFLDEALRVHYRASANWQDLNVDYISTAPIEASSLDKFRINCIVDAVDMGFAASDWFGGEAPEMKLLEPESAKALAQGGYSQRWTLSVKAIPPIYLRKFVEELRWCGDGYGLTSLHIAGTETPDGTELSANEQVVRSWLEEDVFVTPIADLGFTCKRMPGDEGLFGLKLVLANNLSAQVWEWLKAAMVGWAQFVSNYPDADGDEIVTEALAMIPKVSWAGNQFKVLLKHFEHDPEPSFDALQLLLAWVHRKVTPIGEAFVYL